MAKHRAPETCTDKRCGIRAAYLCNACFYRLGWLRWIQ